MFFSPFLEWQVLSGVTGVIQRAWPHTHSARCLRALSSDIEWQCPAIHLVCHQNCLLPSNIPLKPSSTPPPFPPPTCLWRQPNKPLSLCLAIWQPPRTCFHPRSPGWLVRHAGVPLSVEHCRVFCLIGHSTSQTSEWNLKSYRWCTC